MLSYWFLLKTCTVYTVGDIWRKAYAPWHNKKYYNEQATCLLLLLFCKQFISFKNMGLTNYKNKMYILLTNVSIKSCNYRVQLRYLFGGGGGGGGKIYCQTCTVYSAFRSFQALIPVTEIFYLSKRARIQVIKAHRRHFKHILHTFRCLTLTSL